MNQPSRPTDNFRDNLRYVLKTGPRGMQSRLSEGTGISYPMMSSLVSDGDNSRKATLNNAVLIADNLELAIETMILQPSEFEKWCNEQQYNRGAAKV